MLCYDLVTVDSCPREPEQEVPAIIFERARHDHRPSAGSGSRLIDESRWHPRRELVLTWIALAVTFAATGAVFADHVPTLADQIRTAQVGDAVAHAGFLVLVVCLLYGSVVYPVSRIGYIRRRRRHEPAADDSDALFAGDPRSLTILVPAYKEDRAVVYQTLMSAALQEYPARRVVLLIDDPPEPDRPAAKRQLAEVRELPSQIAGLLHTAAQPFLAAAAAYERRQLAGGVDVQRETVRLADLWRRAAAWFAGQARREPIADHTDRHYVDQVLRGRASRYAERAECLLDRRARREPLSAAQIDGEYRRLAALFGCRLDAFERKRYDNLSHAPNKAMNLNSYIGLLGGRFRERVDASGRSLEPAGDGPADLVVAPTDYLITLDADSILQPGYALRLVGEMERPEHQRVGVVQTPYSAVPGARTPVERTAGATTDIQYIIHQGFTQHDATYWVGANALIRYAALEDIMELDEERGHPIKRYIHDRTVIEDTESSIDLASEGWLLHNYPERLAYSATPPDFGALVIQRRRWANGGLIILPKLVRYLGDRRRGRLLEAMLRIHYLISIATVNVALLLLMVLPLGHTDASRWLPLTAMPYLLLYGRDLVLCRYRVADLVRVYALNLVLMPVNLAGVVSSVKQMITGRSTPFRRTPKLADRTTVPPQFVVLSYALVGVWVFATAADATAGNFVRAAFTAANTALLLYGIGAFIGHRNGIADVRTGWFRTVPQRPA